jgi:hypothetical protein
MPSLADFITIMSGFEFSVHTVHRGDYGPSIELRNGSNSEVPILF